MSLFCCLLDLTLRGCDCFVFLNFTVSCGGVEGERAWNLVTLSFLICFSFVFFINRYRYSASMAVVRAADSALDSPNSGLCLLKTLEYTARSSSILSSVFVFEIEICGDCGFISSSGVPGIGMGVKLDFSLLGWLCCIATLTFIFTLLLFRLGGIDWREFMHWFSVCPSWYVVP